MWADDRTLHIGMAAYSLLYIGFYPRIYTSLDESANFGMAYVLRRGTILPAAAGYHLALSGIGPHGAVFRFPIGYAAVLCALSLIGPLALFGINPLMHLAATWSFGRMMRLQGRPATLALLYLLYPPSVLYARTIFSDGFAASLTTLALLSLMSERELIAGSLLGFAAICRSTSLLVAAVIGVGVFIASHGAQTPRGRRIAALTSLFVGMAPFLLGNALYNWLALGSPLASTYNAQMLSLSGLRQHAALYLASTMLIYPGMLLTLAFYRGAFWRSGLLATAVVLLTAAAYHEATFGNNLAETLVAVQRQILPVVPFLLLSYCDLLWRSFAQPSGRGTRLLTLSAGCLLLVAACLSLLHQRYLLTLCSLRDEVTRQVPDGAMLYCNKDIAKLQQPIWHGRRYRVLPGISTRQMADDLRGGPVMIALYLRHRGVAHEESANRALLAELHSGLALAAVPGNSSTDGIAYFRALAARSDK